MLIQLCLALAMLLPRCPLRAQPASDLRGSDDPEQTQEPRAAILRSELATRRALLTFDAEHYALTAALLAGGALAEVHLRPPTEPNWRGGILFDDALRDAMRLGSRQSRDRAATASDYIGLALLAYPLVDAAIMMGRGESQTAWRMLLVDLESFSLSLSVLAVTRNAVGRERPYVGDCAGPGAHDDCGEADSRRSFMSGHTAMAFTAAGLICTHHDALQIHGGAGDTVTCVIATTAAATTGVLRILADRHYTSDVLAGAALGVFSGYLLPRILHYGFGDGPNRASLTPFIGTDYLGAFVRGGF